MPWFMLADGNEWHAITMRAVESAGHFFFRTRNLLFPALLLAVLLAFPPRTGRTDPIVAALLAAGLAALAAGQGLRVATIGLDYIRRGGKNGRIYADRLVTGGLFGHCRNPMYTGNILIALGFFMLAGNPAGTVVGGVLACCIYAAIVHSEERYLMRVFGASYRAYCRDVPRWLPRPLGLARTLCAHRFDWAAVVIREYGTLYTTALIALALLGWKSARAGALDRYIGLYLGGALAASLAYALARYLKKTRRLRALRR